MTDELAAFLRRMLDEDEKWALEASRDPGEPDKFVPTGVHWRWLDGDSDKEITPRPEIDERLVTEDGEAVTAGLVSVETFPGCDILSQHQMPIVASFYIDDMSAAAAGHILRHDPARVLRGIAAKRARLSLHTPTEWPTGTPATCPTCVTWNHDVAMGDDAATPVAYPCPTLRHEAAVYADRDGYRESWRP